MRKQGPGAITTVTLALMTISGLVNQPTPGAACARYGMFTGAGGDCDSGEQTETQAILQLLREMNARWNQHDIDGFMDCFWHSDELVAVVDQEIFRGWNALYRSYEKGYSDRNAMGYVSITRVEVKLLRPDLAAAITWWALEYTPHHTEVTGTSTMDLQKFSGGWRIIFSHAAL